MVPMGRYCNTSNPKKGNEPNYGKLLVPAMEANQGPWAEPRTVVWSVGSMVRGPNFVFLMANDGPPGRTVGQTTVRDWPCQQTSNLFCRDTNGNPEIPIGINPKNDRPHEMSEELRQFPRMLYDESEILTHLGLIIHSFSVSMPILCSNLMFKCQFIAMKAKEQGKDITEQNGAEKLKIRKGDDHQDHSETHRVVHQPAEHYSVPVIGKIQLGDGNDIFMNRRMDQRRGS
uniref:Uncharacterized protein n=1 Tax=Solanum tuberosum TaxID=4113 RepID=M1DRP1_SOLTU